MGTERDPGERRAWKRCRDRTQPGLGGQEAPPGVSSHGLARAFGTLARSRTARRSRCRAEGLELSRGFCMEGCGAGMWRDEDGVQSCRCGSSLPDGSEERAGHRQAHLGGGLQDFLTASQS